MDGEPKTKTSRLERSLPEDTLDNRDEEDLAPIFEDESASDPSTSSVDMDKNDVCDVFKVHTVSDSHSRLPGLVTCYQV